MDNRVSVEFLSLPENEGFARAAAAAFAALLDPTVEELTEIKTGVSEAVSNAIIHGYGEKPDGVVRMECSAFEDRRVMIVISDRGVGIENVAQAREPLFTTGKPEERSGMGFTVMESFMDQVTVESAPGEGTAVTMIKKLDSGHDL